MALISGEGPGFSADFPYGLEHQVRSSFMIIQKEPLLSGMNCFQFQHAQGLFFERVREIWETDAREYGGKSRRGEGYMMDVDYPARSS